jgi:hypothetical protein
MKFEIEGNAGEPNVNVNLESWNVTPTLSSKSLIFISFKPVITPEPESYLIEDVAAYDADSIKPSKYDAVKACDEVVAYEADSTNPSKYEAVNAYDEVTELPLPFKAYDAVKAYDDDSIKPSKYDAVKTYDDVFILSNP